ncbi:MAG: isoleucine--tRNA ligase [Myxococcales bacterium]|nr:isoleucine--tRNA ligase [Myxococcales bacterium]
MTKTFGVFPDLPSVLDFPSEEARTLAFWKEHHIFERTLSAETRHTGPSKGPFVFYEGPPTANGMPHNGHVLTRSIKDVFPRYKTMCGFDVPRKAGWDTHGLPVEVEVEKDLGIHGKAAIEQYGMRPFVQRCIESVFRYTEAWEHNTEHIGFWVDTKDAYVTFHRSYVESVWWALAELHKKGLLYRGHKVVWWWPQGGTALSAAEVGWNYKSVEDPSAFVAFPLLDEPDTSLCVWTTTPWTLPSNGYAAVRGALDYVVVDWREGKKLIVAEALREGLAKKLGLELNILERMKGTALVGKRYRPCFDTFAAELFNVDAALKDGGSCPIYWRVLEASFVTLDAGTGIVHVAPAFGEDDNDAHKAELRLYVEPGAVPLLCGVEPNGTMSSGAGPFAGMWLKDADPLILAELSRRGLLVHEERIRHEYPYCWRADEDPLVQLARPAWYIRTTARIEQAIANNLELTWFPDHVKTGRFGDFLRNNVDWAISRERFWGTPLNVWVCPACEAELAPASSAEILTLNPHAFARFEAERRADPSLSEHLAVHKPWIDDVTLPCACGAVMQRVPEVIDCWFDSGCMPFAQWGFPHAAGSVERFEKAWPADFISEAVDQTRGWFYSLLMVSTMLFDEETCARAGITPRPFPHPFKTCVVLGHVCDRDGKKESKSRGNYTPPDIIIERVRMAFAPLDPGSPKLAKVLGKMQLTGGVAFIAREDFEGLDFAGEEASVWIYRGDREAERVRFRLAPLRGLPRRVIAMSAESLAQLDVVACSQGLEVKPVDVPRLAQNERVFVEDPTRSAPGADAFRWFFYAASLPWTNTRHSLSNVRLLQKDFLIKLRNVHSFFTIYANIDGFSPSAACPDATDTAVETLAGHADYRRIRERSEIDRWLASEVAIAVREVRSALDGYMVYDAAQRIVELVDALSNWYVRRSRSRFWASVDEPLARADKLDATFTLYEALVTICRLSAPFVPFFAEGMYQNLVRGPWPTSQPLSVHLAAYPEPDTAAIDDGLGSEMRAVRELVSLGQKVRTDNKLRVRQPLARCDVVVSNAELQPRLVRHAALLADELNVKELRWLEPGQEAGEVSYRLKPNFRALGPRLGKKVQAVKLALEHADAARLRTELATTGTASITVDGEPLTLSGEEIEVAIVPREGFAAAGGRVGVVVLHTELTDELLDDGFARDLLAKVQSARKELELGFTEKVTLRLYGGERVRRIAAARESEFTREALCHRVVLGPLEEAPTALVKSAIGDEELALELVR